MALPGVERAAETGGHSLIICSLRPEAKNAQFEGTLTLSHEQFLEKKQVDMKMVAGRFELYSAYPIQVAAIPARLKPT